MAVQAFVDAAVELEQDPETSKEFVITPELRLVCKPKLALYNCEATFEFVSLEYLKRLVDRILEEKICAELWGGVSRSAIVRKVLGKPGFWCFLLRSAYGSRTRAPALRGLCPNH